MLTKVTVIIHLVIRLKAWIINLKEAAVKRSADKDSLPFCIVVDQDLLIGLKNGI